ncbi:hypothetical protein [Streptomyces globosus]|uniref:hypothetical protein n=1 Tax=Streptomyces globosus TaxID=68209 RepID=UPI00380F8D02
MTRLLYKREVRVGLCLFPDDGEICGPDACFSYTSFHLFRRRLASAEGFSLDGMQGFGGDIPWSDVRTVLEPLLNHPDDHGRDLTAEECAAMLPRIEEIFPDWLPGADSDPDMRHQERQLRDLISVLRVCVRKGVGMYFL